MRLPGTMSNIWHKLTARLKCLASNPGTPPAVLNALSWLDNISLLERVAEHPCTPPDTMVKLSRHPASEVRIALGNNPRCLIWLICKLCHDSDVDVRYSLAENPNMPIEVLQRLSADDNPYVAVRARRTLMRADCERPARMLRMLFPIKGVIRNTG